MTTLEPEPPVDSHGRKFNFTKMRVLANSTESLSFDGDEDDDDSSAIGNDFDSRSSPAFHEYGLLITTYDGHCRFNLCTDKNFPEIHPNVYAPDAMRDCQLLAGGGSGVAVFAGEHPELGKIVMKHGGYKDLQELFALVTIEQELKGRGSSNGNQQAAEDMQRRLPEFKMIYISPFHIVEKGIGFWDHLQSLVDAYSTTIRHYPDTNGRRSSFYLDGSLLECLVNQGMNIRILESNKDLFAIELDTTSKQRKLSVILPKDSCQKSGSKTVTLVRENSYDGLRETVDELLPILQDIRYKFTLAQKTIGGKEPKTGNQWLYKGKLTGPLLENLINQFIQVVKHLQKLTLPEEVDVVEEVREELLRLESDSDAKVGDIKELANTFVGSAIKKNFKEEKGRVHVLRKLGQKFKTESLVLIPEEVFPAKCLGELLQRGALMSDTFLNAPEEPTFCPEDEFWKDILRQAVDDRDTMSPSALKRVWNCGLADAGIHNLFVSEDDLYLFDLGEPQLQSLPGFLTKFLFSFFHTLGMEEDASGESWVRRFDRDGEKLSLTKETKELLPKAYHAFETCLDRIVNELLDGDKKIRWLLLQYVTLQLLSDTAFCLQRWLIKGGGSNRENNHQKNVEKWLWRALWDVYIAGDINTQESWARFGVEQVLGVELDTPSRLSLLEGTASLREISESIRHMQFTNV